ncbi:MAG TPA: ATP-binding protein [Chitinophagaceae bacterium]|nr:ATP-binding protein [Chitinophagaceae bacterium]
MEQDEIIRLQEINKLLWKELEEKNRKLEVEASLEKVRSRTMTMRNSSELSAASAVLFHEINQLGIKAIRTGVGIFDDTNTAMELWTTSISDNKEVLQKLDYFSLYIHSVYENLIPSRQQQKPYAVTRLKGNQVKHYYQSMTAFINTAEQHVYNEEEYFYSFFFEQGTLNVVTHQSLTDEECRVLTRFAHAFGLIYTRFLDLQKAESQTNEALKEAALDKVRAEIASMRTAHDLEHITPLIWKELITLEVPFSRCGIFIIREEEKLVHAYLSTPEGKSLAVLHLGFDDNDTTKTIIENWRNKTAYKVHWDQEQFQNWVQSIYAQGHHSVTERFSEYGDLFSGLNLHFIPFSQGMFYIGGQETLVEYEIDLVRSLADTFSVAYARYEDFMQLENAKNKIEITLSELKATQSQLIQAEKMASLGELTAGIAHEIQNPLNFVNNFSEVNEELIKELIDEAKKGNLEEVKAIVKDIEFNSEKINHHGKRADAIVKGMLQHSRSSSGIKEPTDINALCDEYLRLAYHGIRAKDKSFNASMKTDFDETIGNINIIPQDIGRVILNLINNAFYAVDEKKEQIAGGYEPTVSVSTKKVNGTVEIKVADNGNGIPQKVLDKIFQPFFTTKPTGQGTGLGLSLSYDIIKVHGGELKVETQEGEGAAFIIQLPI